MPKFSSFSTKKPHGCSEVLDKWNFGENRSRQQFSTSFVRPEGLYALYCTCPNGFFAWINVRFCKMNEN